MNISQIGTNAIKMNQNVFQKTTEPTQSKTSFANVIKGYLENVDSTVKQASDLSTQAAAGNVENIHDVMIASQKAKLALELTVNVRDKAVEAYQEMMRMQI
ncbi:flagellar hook-basal body complex protein FliE [Neobacillus sp. MM2021_6]|uniref:flagellar hook-basal body complex protein FliE n=1 Tax=Bacillaceae TaxID=186817 RepID=UPI00140E3598|nr:MULTISPECIES: flagellar hook-basal body complex protein FliE [Bacillaceae]MBO0961061.1 flagellar hook-basal body complex protein FliE [Neobacillus sp. MM2021_6]NHC20655.1 flagellar hook-basal body complex protein FliE [Bacillus sp. MM2020_4]WML39388.1 flagellar hook-basal body complex protein FliE [Neobacillus sp. OS1-2]